MIGDEDPNGDFAGFAAAHNLNPLAYAGRCVKLTSRGTRCTRKAITGGSVCTMHGGSNPHIVAAARLRLMTLVDPAITVLADEMVNAEKSADRRLAAMAILDRAGVGPKADPDDSHTRELLKARIMAVQGEAETVSEVPAAEEQLAIEQGIVDAMDAASQFASPYAPSHNPTPRFGSLTKPEHASNGHSGQTAHGTDPLPPPQIVTALEDVSGTVIPPGFYYDDEDGDDEDDEEDE